MFAGGDEGWGDRTTNGQAPLQAGTSGSCVWVASIGPGNNDAPPADDPDPADCMAGTRDAYAIARADDMQVWGYAWAKDQCLGSQSASASAASGGGWASVTLITEPGGCEPHVRCDWKPRFRIRVELNDEDGEAFAAAYMKGDCRNLPVHVEPKRALKRTSWPSGGNSVTLGPVTVPLTECSGAGTEESTEQAWQSADLPLTYDKAPWSCSVSVSATTDDAFDYAEAHAFVWDSLPGLDLHGYRKQCPGTATVTYGWYQ